MTHSEDEIINKLKDEKMELARRLNKLSADLIIILKNKALRGCNVKSWKGFQNGNGTDVGKDIENLIKQAERTQEYLLTVKHD